MDDDIAKIQAIIDTELKSRAFVSAEDANAFWLIFGTVTVFFMQAGFAMLEASAVRESSIGRVLLKNVFDASFAGLLWWATGYGLAFGADSFEASGHNGVAGTSGFFYEGRGPLTSGRFAKMHGQAFYSFQWAFAGVAATITSGAVAGRCTYFAYVVYSCLLSGFIYPVVVHLAWSQDGRLSPFRSGRLIGGCGLIDFAGSGVVHLTGGVAALVAAIFVAPRPGVFQDGPSSQEPAKYGVVLQTLGVLILWVGWYGFNGVSSLVVSGGGAGIAAHAAFNTTLAASAGCVTCTLIGFRCSQGRSSSSQLGSTMLDPTYTTNGILAGLVSVTAGCALLEPWGALVTGITGAFVFHAGSRAVFALQIDDVVDAFAVHGACGIWGLICAALMSTKYYYAQVYEDPDRAKKCQGLFFTGAKGGSLGAVFAFLLVELVWVGGAMVCLMYGLKHTVGVDINRGGAAGCEFDDDVDYEYDNTFQSSRQVEKEHDASPSLQMGSDQSISLEISHEPDSRLRDEDGNISGDEEDPASVIVEATTTRSTTARRHSSEIFNTDN